MRISRSTWNAYIKKLSQIQSKAADLMQSYINQHGTADSNALIAYAYSLSSHYGSAAAALACNMYDTMAAEQGATVPDAEPADGYTYQETAIIINGAKKQSESLISPAVSRMVKQAAADTTTQNAIRDGAEWAWIPNGDTCAFCLTLASRGWQRASKETLKGNHAQHIHANCDCNFCIRFDKKSSVAGYDPDALRDKYYNADGDTPTDKINSMRREIYAKNKDAINAQKRAAYAKNKLESISATGENKFKKGFTKNNLEVHFGVNGKHTKEYPGWTKEKYNEEALKLVQSATSDDILGYKRKDGSVVRYRISTNDYVAGYPNDGIATMYKPRDGIAYYNRRLKKEDGITND